MKLSVTYFGQIRAAIGRATEEMDTPEIGTPNLGTKAGSVAGLIEAIARQHGPEVRRLLLDADGKPRTSLMVIINDEQWLPADTTLLKPGDRVTLLPPISGGRTAS